jgi:putative cardiolipin synthase
VGNSLLKIARNLGIVLLVAVALFYLSFWLFLKWGSLQNSKSLGVNASVFERSRSPHQLTLLNNGILSYSERLRIIRQAKKSIQLEFFIYNLDQASRVLTQEIINKAHEGVKVRILVDFAAPVFQLAPNYVAYLQKEGVEVRYYNTSKFYKIFAYQHRSHRKLLIVDDEIVISGGRNIATEYFDLSPNYDFLDSDVKIVGEIAKTARKSFDLYWNSEYATNNKEGSSQSVADFFKHTVEDDEFEAQILRSTENHIHASHTCNDLSFVSDLPGVSAEHRKVYWALKELFLQADTEILGESPYFVMADEGINLLHELHKKNITVTMLTNSLFSTDAFYTVAPLYEKLDQISKTKINLWIYSGQAPDLSAHPFPEMVSARWGTHSKRAIVDGKHLVIGTYNVDPRSANLNSEVVFICRNSPSLALESKADYESRLKNAFPLTENGEIHKNNLFQGSSFKQKLMFWLSMPFATRFSFLL